MGALIPLGMPEWHKKMSELLSEALIKCPCIPFLEAQDSFIKIFKKPQYCYSVRGRIQTIFSKTLETIGLTTIGCVCLIPCAVGLVCFIPEKIIVLSIKKL